MAKITLSTLTSAFSSIAKLNANFTALVSALQNDVLYRNNPAGEPNQMENSLDMNSNDIENVNAAYLQTLYISGQEVVPTELAVVPVGEMPLGTVSAPGLAFTGDPDTGLYQASADTVSVAVAGAEVLTASSTGVQVQGDVTCTDDMSCDRITAASMTITTGGLVISAGGLNVTGTVTLPAFTIATGSVCTTQTQGDNSTKLASTAYVDAAVAAVPAAQTYEHVRAYRTSSGQTISNASLTTVIFNAEDYDTGADFDVATGVFTVPTTGYYSISANVQLGSTTWNSGEYAYLSVYKNGSTEALGGKVEFPVAGAHAQSLSVSGTLYLTATDTIHIKVYQGSGSSAGVSTGSEISYVTIDRIP